MDRYHLSDDMEMVLLDDGDGNLRCDLCDISKPNLRPVVYSRSREQLLCFRCAESLVLITAVTD